MDAKKPMTHTGNGSGRKRKINKVLSNNIESGYVQKKQRSSNVNLEVKQNVGSQKQLRIFRRAWKYKISNDALIDKIGNDIMAKCAYVSGRTQLSCTNVRRKSELDSNGFCEIHARFFRQLRELYIAEQRRSDPGFFTAKVLDEDDSLLVSDEDETLSTPLEWPASCEDLYGGFSENIDCHPLQLSNVLSDEECLLIRLALLERKKRAMKTYRELLTEKAKRRAAFYKKKMMEEVKKGGVVATNRKERSLMQSYQALKKYRRWMFSSFSRYMKRKNDLRLKLKSDNEDKFAYLDVTSKNGATKICAFIRQAVSDNSACSTANSSSNSLTQFQADVQCLEPVIPGSSYCLKHIAEDTEQKLFSICSSCSAVIADIGSLLCSEKGIRVRVGKECAFCSKLQMVAEDSVSMASSCESLLVEENQAKSLVTGNRNIRELSEGQFTSNAVMDSSESMIVDNEKTIRKRRFDDSDSLEGNVKYVVIASSDEDGEEVFKLPGDLSTNRPKFIPGIAPQFSTRNRPFNESKITAETNCKVVTEYSNLVTSPSFSLQKRLNIKVKDTCTCARVRPFQRVAVFDEKDRKKRKLSNQLGTSECYYAAGLLEGQKKSIKVSMSSIRPSSSVVQTTLVHHVKTNASKKPQSSLHFVQSQTLGLVPQRINAGPGRASISANSNLQPPKLARVTASGQRGLQSPSYSLLMDPSMISLGPSSSGEVASHMSKTYCSHPSAKPEMQQNQAEVFLRTSNSVPQTYVRSVNNSSTEEGRRFTYKSYSGMPRIVSGYRSHGSIIVGNSNSVPSFRSVQQNQYSENRTVGAERQSSSEQYYHRSDRAFTPQGVRSRLAYIESPRNLYHSVTYSPYQGNNITSRMREVPRSELRHYSRYETYVDPFTTDSRLPRNTFDAEAAAAVASIVNERSDADEADALESSDKIALDYDNVKSTSRQNVLISEQSCKESFSDSLSAKKVDVKPDEVSVDISTCNIVGSSSDEKFKCDDPRKMSPKISSQDRHEDGLAVLALAAESHAAVRSRKSVITSEPGFVPAGQDKVESDTTPSEETNKNTANDEEQHNSAPYKILGFEEEDEDDF
uniref:Zf-C3Hc3H domain-containing protein n=1 Tax=Syphacia muris TaxID=451379 RepID=A0A0N5AJ56_9BILA